MMIPLGPYRLNIDALLARILYRWRLRSLGILVLALLLIGLSSGLIPPFWKQPATLTIIGAPGARVQVDGKSWPRPIYAGQHTLLATMPDGRGAWAEISLQATQVLTLTLPTGLAEPRERSLPPAAPGSQIEQVWWADGSWRVTSRAIPPARVPDSDEPTPTPAPPQTIALSAQHVERLATMDAYAGLADQVHSDGRLIEAVYRPQSEFGYRDRELGSLEIRGWGETNVTLPISEPLTLVRFAPDGKALLEAEQVATGGVQIYLLRPNQGRVPVVAVPGQIVRLSWRADSSAVVIHSIQQERLTLTLVRLAPTLIAAAIADLDAANAAAALAPLTWDAQGLLWVAPDDAGVSTLWSAPLTTLIPERRGTLEARALTMLPDGSLRLVAIQGKDVVIGRYLTEQGILIGETTVPRVPPAPDLAGMWVGDELLLQGDRRAWLLDLAEGE